MLVFDGGILALHMNVDDNKFWTDEMKLPKPTPPRKPVLRGISQQQAHIRGFSLSETIESKKRHNMLRRLKKDTRTVYCDCCKRDYRWRTYHENHVFRKIHTDNLESFKNC
jgi:hypothetical protein